MDGHGWRKSAVETRIWSLLHLYGFKLGSQLGADANRRESSASHETGFVLDFIAPWRCSVCRTIYEPSGMKAEGHPRARECRERQLVVHGAHSDGGLQPDGRGGRTPLCRRASAACEVTGRQGQLVHRDLCDGAGW